MMRFLIAAMMMFVVFNLKGQEIGDVDVPATPIEETYIVVQDMPEYPGGDEARVKFIYHNLQYPSDAKAKRIQGTVFVTFVIDTAGNVRDAEILKGMGYGCDEEALRVVRLMPRWNPGKQSGKAVRVQFNMAIKFSL